MSAARAAVALACLDALPDAQLGTVRLHQHQRRMVARATRALARQGGCLIGDDVGRGKTFVALCLAQRWRHPLVIAPASLRSTWRTAAGQALVSCAFLSHESLSRGTSPRGPFDGIIVDESHHFRTTSTRRYAGLTGLAAAAPLVLLSATPLQNRPRDLAAQVALFHGERAFTLDAEALARFIIRGDEAGADAMPGVLDPEWLGTGWDDGVVLEAILALPAPARPLDGGDAGALRVIGLVRAWASSRAALRAALRSRTRLATAIAQGADDGRAPTRREARAWHAAEDVVQLGFPALLMRATPAAVTLAGLRAALDDDERALERLAAVLDAAPDPDAWRVAAIRNLRTAHPSARIIAFTEYATTAAAMFAGLRRDAGVGLLTAREARIVTGRIARDDLLARFAPLAQHARPAAAQDSVTLLLATDLLSEGVNLQDASIVLHLDLPWNPARLAQRVGRVRRPGGAREVRTFLLAPPATAASLLAAEARLRHKVAQAASVVGAGFAVLPALAWHGGGTARGHCGAGTGLAVSATDEGAVVERLERWSEQAPRRARGRMPCVVAAVSAPASGWLAAWSDGRVAGRLHGRTSEALTMVRRLAELAEGVARPPARDEARRALLELAAWRTAERVATTCGIAESPGPLRRAVTEWLDAAVRTMPRHTHGVALPLIAQFRDHLRQPLALGTEQALADLTRRGWLGTGDPVERLAAALRIAAAGVCGRGADATDDATDHAAAPVALILVGPGNVTAGGDAGPAA